MELGEAERAGTGARRRPGLWDPGGPCSSPASASLNKGWALNHRSRPALEDRGLASKDQLPPGEVSRVP